MLPIAAPVYANTSTEDDKAMRELDRIQDLSANKHKFGRYTYVPRVTEGQSGAYGYSILRDGKTVYEYLPVPVDKEKTWLEQQLSSTGATRIPTKPNRGVSDILDPVGPKLPVGNDVTGNGHPDLIVCSWTRGAHCCFDYTVLSLGKSFAKLPTIKGQDHQFVFKDLDSDGISEAIGYDSNFDYWNVSYADSPAPLVILTFRRGKPVLDVALMKTPPLTDAQLRTMADKLTKEIHKDQSQREANGASTASNGAILAPEIWRDMLNLIYTGNGKQAWELFDLVWPRGTKGYWLGDPKYPENRDEFLASFKKQLAKSDYWIGLKQMNRWKK
jgi:hypothetical protein